MCFFKLVELFYNVDGQANGAGIVGDGAGNALANPPVGVSGKLCSPYRDQIFRLRG